MFLRCHGRTGSRDSWLQESASASNPYNLCRSVNGSFFKPQMKTSVRLQSEQWRTIINRIRTSFRHVFHMVAGGSSSMTWPSSTWAGSPVLNPAVPTLPRTSSWLCRMEFRTIKTIFLWRHTRVCTSKA